MEDERKMPETAHVLVVDDDIAIIGLVRKGINRLGYLCDIASDGEAALEILKKEKFDVVITDIIMPGLTGIQLLQIIKEKYDTDVIVMTGHAEDYAYENIIDEGASDFIQKPINIKELLLRLKRVLFERTLLFERNKANLDLKDTLDILRKSLSGTIQVIASTVECRDPYTSGHQRRVAHLGYAIAQEMKLPEDIIDGIRMAGVIHDLGKIAIPAEILSKPARLTDIEFSLIKTHPQIGFDILKDIDFPWPVAKITYQHHERMDGSGYPLGLKGKDILLESRIIAVADVVEAMSSHRPYRAGLGIDTALEEILKNKGRYYDPDVVDSCEILFSKKNFCFE